MFTMSLAVTKLISLRTIFHFFLRSYWIYTASRGYDFIIRQQIYAIKMCSSTHRFVFNWQTPNEVYCIEDGITCKKVNQKTE